MSNDNGRLLQKLEAAAILYADGHFTLMRLTTNWRCSLGTPASREDIKEMFEGKTMEEAISRCLEAVLK